MNSKLTKTEEKIFSFLGDNIKHFEFKTKDDGKVFYYFTNVPPVRARKMYEQIKNHTLSSYDHEYVLDHPEMHDFMYTDMHKNINKKYTVSTSLYIDEAKTGKVYTVKITKK